MPTGVVSVDDKQHVYVRLINLSAHHIQIPRRQQIGTLSRVKLVENGWQASVKQQHVKTDGNNAVANDVSANEVLQALVDIDLSETVLDPSQKNQVHELLKRCNSVFAANSIELGNAVGVEHRIKLTDDTPFKERPRRIPPAMYKEVQKHIQEMLAAGAIRHSKSPYSSNVVLVRKKDGKLRVCIDYRRLNNRTVRDAYNIPVIDAALDNLCGAKWFSTLDLQAGYWQIQLAEEDKEKTAFCVGNLGFYEAERMPFGLTNAPATFQRLMEQTLADLTNTMAYLDDVIIYSSTFDEHITRLEAVFNKLQQQGLKLKPSKCHLFQKRVKYLGHVISENGIEADPEKIDAVKKWPIPKTIQDLRQTLGFFGYYRRFVKDYSKLARPLHQLLQGHENAKRTNKKIEVQFDEDAVSAFEVMKEKLTTLPILAYADFSLPFELHTDASGVGLGAVLYQEQDSVKRVIAYASRGLRQSEQHYSAHRLEFLALKWAITEKFRDYLFGNHFEVFTDNNPLCYVLSTAKLDATGHRWLAELSTFDFSINYRSGKKNVDADSLSRCIPESKHVQTEVVSAVCKQMTVEQPEMLFDTQEVIAYQETVEVPAAVIEANRRKWKQLQQYDPVLGRIIPIIQRGTKLTSREVALIVKDCPDFKIYWRTWERLCIRNGVLCRSRDVNGTKTHQIVLPESEREATLRGLHDGVGHLGRDRTLDLVRSRFYWPKMTEQVQEYVKKCLPCIKRKAHVPDRAPLVPITTTQPMELLCIDFLTLEPSKGGVENILVMTDHFTRYAHAVPTRNQTAKTTAKVLYDFFLHYGFPLRVHSDQGRNFESKVIKELCEMAGTQKSRTTPYHPMGNGLCERFNSTLMNMLGTMEDRQKHDWKTYVPGLVHAYNCTKHDSTGYSPFYLMFGRHPRLPIDIIMGIELEEREVQSTVRYVEELQEKLKYAYDTAEKESRLATREQKQRYDRRIKGAVVQVGDRVLVKNVTIRGKSKLANKFEDDVYIVKEQPNKDIPVFIVEAEQGPRRRRTLHRNLLLPVNFLPLKPVSTSAKQRQPPRKASAVNSSMESESSGEQSTDEDETERGLNPDALVFEPAVPSSESVKVHIEEDNEVMRNSDSPENTTYDSEDETESNKSTNIEDNEKTHVVNKTVKDNVTKPIPRPRRTVRKPVRYESEDFRASRQQLVESAMEIVTNISNMFQTIGIDIT